MPTKNAKRGKPRSASKATTSAQKRVGRRGRNRAGADEQTPNTEVTGQSRESQVGERQAQAKDTRSYQERYAEYTKNREKGPQAPGSGPVETDRPSRAVVGRPEFATAGDGAPLGAAASGTDKATRGKPADSTTGAVVSGAAKETGTAPDGTPRYAAIVGPPEGSLFSSALDATAHAASLDDLDAAAESLPPGTTIEFLGKQGGFRVMTSGMHKITGNGRTLLEAIKNLGVNEPMDHEKPEALRPQAVVQQEEKARADRARIEAQTAGEEAPETEARTAEGAVAETLPRRGART